MVARIISILLAALPLVTSAQSFPAGTPPPATLVEIAPEQVDRSRLLPSDAALLDDRRFHWRHLRTPHFILHHDQKMFASKVARMGEQFYSSIAADLPGLADRITPAPSHIFIFRDPRDWQSVLAAEPGVESWAASFVRGQVMYLQETGMSASDKMSTLAHEMTHLVFNRFLPVRLPLWLNEGLAEYYGEFAYRAAKGMGQSKSNAFRPLRAWTPLESLLSATDYPANPADVASFYSTSKYLVGFLLLRHPREKWDRFLVRLLAARPPTESLLEVYGWPDIAAAERDFAKFAR